MAILEAERSTNLKRTTVHHVYNGKLFGIPMLTKQIPICFYVKQIGGNHKKIVISFDPLTRKSMAYKDLGLVEKCCNRVIGFNIRHYLQCYLTGDQSGPYTWSQCKKCNVGIVDEKGHTIQQIAKRSYRRDSYIFKACKTLQDDSSREGEFNYQERAQSNGC